MEPKVSEHIPEIIALIEQLVARGAAYEVTMPSGARDVYYSVRAFPGYGKLSKRNVDDMRVGARVEATRRSATRWTSPCGRACVGRRLGLGQPLGQGAAGLAHRVLGDVGRYLGHGFDVHCGGMDLIFPHHENEIAQSEAAHPDEGGFVSIWIHNGFVNVDKEKMSKSLGNFVTSATCSRATTPRRSATSSSRCTTAGPSRFDVENRCRACDAVRPRGTRPSRALPAASSARGASSSPASSRPSGASTTCTRRSARLDDPPARPSRRHPGRRRIPKDFDPLHQARGRRASTG